MADNKAKKKKKFLVLTLVSSGIALLGLILAIVGLAIIDGNKGAGIALLIVGLIPLVGGGIMFYFVYEASRKYCVHCGASMKGCEYEYQLREKKVEAGANYTNVKFTYDIVGYCPECGEPNHSTKTFSVRAGENPDAKARNYCRSKFGH